MVSKGLSWSYISVHVSAFRFFYGITLRKNLNHFVIPCPKTKQKLPQFLSFVEVENLAKAVNFGWNKVRFYSPVPVGSRVRGRATVIQARIRGGALHLLSQIKVEIEGVKKPACVAETLGIYIFNENELEQPAAQLA